MSFLVLNFNLRKYTKYTIINFISREKFEPEPEPGLELGPPDLLPGTLPLSYPGSTASSPSNLPLESGQ